MDKLPKILCVDDDEMLANLMARMLMKKGFETFSIYSAKDACEIIDKEHIDLVLSDIEMPNYSGIDLLKNIRKRYDSIKLPVIMVTGRDDDASLIDALSCGANDYISKPLNFDRAEARIKVQLQLKTLSAELSNIRRREAVNAMVITYNHEINNPLCIAKGYLSIAMKECNCNELVHVDGALDRIAEIVKKIQDLTEKSEFILESYASSDSDMVSLKKE